MRELQKAGADSFLPNADKTTPLMAAAGLGTSDPLEEAGTEDEALHAVKMLLDLGADINAVDDKGGHRHARRGVRKLPAIVRTAVPISTSGNGPTPREGRRCLLPRATKPDAPTFPPDH